MTRPRRSRTARGRSAEPEIPCEKVVRGVWDQFRLRSRDLVSMCQRQQPLLSIGCHHDHYSDQGTWALGVRAAGTWRFPASPVLVRRTLSNLSVHHNPTFLTLTLPSSCAFILPVSFLLCLMWSRLRVVLQKLRPADDESTRGLSVCVSLGSSVSLSRYSFVLSSRLRSLLPSR